MTIPDPIALIVELLQLDAAVTALVGSRVHGGQLSKETRGGMPQPAVVVSPAGGPGRPGYMRIRRNRIDTVCYGPTLHESWLVHLAVREVLEDLRVDGPLRSLEISSDGANALDPTTLWPTCYASYTVLSAVTA